MSVLLLTEMKNACDKGMSNLHLAAMVPHAPLVMSRLVSTCWVTMIFIPIVISIISRWPCFGMKLKGISKMLAHASHSSHRMQHALHVLSRWLAFTLPLVSGAWLKWHPCSFAIQLPPALWKCHQTLLAQFCKQEYLLIWESKLWRLYLHWVTCLSKIFLPAGEKASTGANGDKPDITAPFFQLAAPCLQGLSKLLPWRLQC